MDIAAYVLLGIASVVLTFAGLHGFHNKSITIISFGVGAFLVIVSGCLYWQDAVWKNDARLNPAPVTEPKRPSATPAVSQATASPSPSPSPTEKPATTLPLTIPSPIKLPSATPEHRVAAMSFREAERKLSEAINSTETGKYNEVKNALKGLQVDWTLNFHSADRDSSGKWMRVWLQDKEQILGFAVVKLPLAGNERFPLMEQTDVFRVRGIIEDDPTVIAIWLRDATIEYVRSDPKK